MRRALATLVILHLLLPSSAQVKSLPDQLQVTTLRLSNGMTVWLNEDHSQPKVFGAVVVNAGARDCPGTGIAHYFEHLLFKGTEEMGTIDYSAERPLLDSISLCYDQLATAKDETVRRQTLSAIGRLSRQASEYAIPNEFNRLTQLYGGSPPNAGTSWDFTYYHGTFTPGNIEHWCEMNSHRLIHPVFRLFQNELATVIEEKNTYADDLLSSVREQMMQELFGTLPYAYPIIGSREELLHPRLSALQSFYRRYYVGSNMGLILCGDIDTRHLKPLLERTFGRIPRGEAPQRPPSPLPDITEERTAPLHLPLPLVDLGILAYKAPTEYAPDANALDVALSLLSDQQTGMLDSLCHDGTLLSAMAALQGLNDAGLAYLLFMPPIFGSSPSAERACLEQVRRLCEGRYSKDTFESHRRETFQEALRSLETIDDRAQKMVRVMASGHTWQAYLDKVNALNTLTQDDVTAAARKYLGAPFVRFKKMEESHRESPLPLPARAQASPRHPDAESVFAQYLHSIPTPQQQPRAIRFDRDATITPLGGTATLYTVANPIDHLFELTLTYNHGQYADRHVEALCQWLNTADTDSEGRQAWENKLHSIGATLLSTSTEHTFNLLISGEDAHFEATLQLVGHLLQHIRPATLNEAKEKEKQGKKDDEALRALLMKVMMGDRSPYLAPTTPPNEDAPSSTDMTAVLDNVLKSACHIIYSGSLQSETVGEAIRRHLPIRRSTVPYIDYSVTPLHYDEPMVYVYDTPHARQSHIFTYETIAPTPTLEEYVPLLLLKNYFGSGMSSVLFQEIREYRSMAYLTSSHLHSRPRLLSPDSRQAFYNVIDVATEKTMDAIALLDSLLRDMPVREKNFEAIRHAAISDINLQHPTFRTMGQHIAHLQWEGYQSDPSAATASLLGSATLGDMMDFYNKNVRRNGRHRVVGIVGDLHALNMAALARYGQVVVLGESDLFGK